MKDTMQHSQEKIDKAIKEIAQDEVVQFFKERVKNGACPSCFNTNWSFVGGQGHTICMMALTKDGNFQIPPPSVPVFAIACNNCGHVRTHALGIVAMWKLAKDERKP